MLIIGEGINSTRKSINEAIDKKDIRFIQAEAINQVKAGASMLDVNCGTDIKEESTNMEWLVRVIQEVVDAPLVIDSPSPEAIESGLKIHKGRAMINSTTGERKRMEEILSLVKKYNAGVIALTIDERGMPKTSDDRLDIAKKILDEARKYDIEESVVYFDPLVRPISTEQEQAKEFLGAIRLIKTSLGARTICGLSNISFGLPNRSLLNSTFLAMAMYAGLDAAIIDSTDKNMIAAIKSAEALLNKDEYCMNYINWFRNGKK